MSKLNLVLGGNGFLGYYITQELVRSGNRVRCLTHRTVRDEDTIPGVEYITGDAFNSEVLAQAVEGVEAVYYFISTSLPNSGERYLDNEIRMTLNSLDLMLHIMAEHGIRKFIYPSSGGAIYGDQSNAPVSENTLLEPTTAYGVGKQMSEALIGFYCRKHNFDSYIYRIGNVYGSDRLRDKPQGVIDVFIQAALKDESLKIWGDATHSIRDYIYLEDAAKAIVSSSMKELCGLNIFNVGTGKGTSVKKIISEIENNLGHNLRLERYPQKASGVSSIVLDSTRIQQVCNWRPEISIEEGIKRTIESKRKVLGCL